MPTRIIRPDTRIEGQIGIIQKDFRALGDTTMDSSYYFNFFCEDFLATKVQKEYHKFSNKELRRLITCNYDLYTQRGENIIRHEVCNLYNFYEEHPGTDIPTPENLGLTFNDINRMYDIGVTTTLKSESQKLKYSSLLIDEIFKDKYPKRKHISPVFITSTVLTITWVILVLAFTAGDGYWWLTTLGIFTGAVSVFISLILAYYLLQTIFVFFFNLFIELKLRRTISQIEREWAIVIEGLNQIKQKQSAYLNNPDSESKETFPEEASPEYKFDFIENLVAAVLVLLGLYAFIAFYLLIDALNKPKIGFQYYTEDFLLCSILATMVSASYYFYKFFSRKFSKGRYLVVIPILTAIGAFVYACIYVDKIWGNPVAFCLLSIFVIATIIHTVAKSKK